MRHNPPYPGAPSTKRDLATVRSPTLGLFASDGENYRDALFGRDALEGAEDLLEIDPSIAHTVIHALARLQGRVDSLPGPTCNEEEIGRIHHEARERSPDGHRVNAHSDAIISKLAAQWGGNDDGFVYFGTVDATPLFVRLIDRYCARYGPELLSEPVTGADGTATTIGASCKAALGWIERSIDQSSVGFVEFQRTNPHGLNNQAWKDSFTAYIHPDGTLANHNAPIAPVEVQGIAYDALAAGARLFAHSNPSDAARWKAGATALKQRIFEKLWMPDEQYFALGLDRDPTSGAPRQIRTLSSNGAALMDTTLFDNCSERERSQYLPGICSMILGKGFLTAVGIRSRHLTASPDLGYFEYQGPYTVWTKESYDIAKGLRRQGFPLLARQLEQRILNGLNTAGQHVEYLYVKKDGTPIYRLVDGKGPSAIIATNIPDRAQTWSITAARAIKWRNGHPDAFSTSYPSPWHEAFDRLCAASLPVITIIRHVRDLKSLHEAFPATAINRSRGQTVEGRLVRQSDRYPEKSLAVSSTTQKGHSSTRRSAVLEGALAGVS